MFWKKSCKVWEKIYAAINGYNSSKFDIDGLVQDCSNSIANALELLQSCTKPSILWRPVTWPRIRSHRSVTRGWRIPTFQFVSIASPVLCTDFRPRGEAVRPTAKKAGSTARPVLRTIAFSMEYACHWNENIFVLMKLSSLTALEVVLLTTSSAPNDKHFVKMIFFQWLPINLYGYVLLKRPHPSGLSHQRTGQVFGVRDFEDWVTVCRALKFKPAAAYI